MSKGGINKVTLIGNLGDDPEIRTVPSGHKVANFSIATSSSYKDGNEQWQEKTEWHSIVAWRHLADTVEQYMHKGQQVYVEGSLETRSWEDKNTGAKKYKTEIIAKDIQMTGSRKNDDGGNQSGDDGGGGYSSYQSPPVAAGDAHEDDLPF